MKPNKKKKQKENDVLAQTIINSGQKQTHNPITGQPYDLPLVVEHPGLDLALMYAQPGSIFSKVLAPSMAKGVVNGLANGEGAQALFYGLVPESSIAANIAVRSAQKASKAASGKARELKTLKQKYEKILSEAQNEADAYEMLGGEAHYGVPYSSYNSNYSKQLNSLETQISNLEFELNLPVSNPYALSDNYYWQYRKRSPKLQKSSYRLYGPPIAEELPKYHYPTQVEIDDLPFKNGGKIKSIF